ncbi:BTB/POZ domain-containing protein 21 [Elsinoe australis]|uniref:BTB/POZ domain-containing protein 21 n=1 Tax=Elsinoe australis TaxID=40998 RepID=A0A4U7AS08_9PEZI|nr:BTB/POZ domain-containing protein 21 [Elsinoe australis]
MSEGGKKCSNKSGASGEFVFGSVTTATSSPCSSYGTAKSSFAPEGAPQGKFMGFPNPLKEWSRAAVRYEVYNPVEQFIELHSHCIIEGSAIVSLKLGLYEISVHKSLLIHFSEYYRPVLTGSFAEADSQKIDPINSHFQRATLQHFLCWIYTGETNLSTNKASDVNTGVDLYIFADRYKIPALRIAIKDFLATALPTTLGETLRQPLPPQEVVENIFNNLDVDDGLCNLIAEVFATHWKPWSSVAKHAGPALDSFPAAFVNKLAIQLANIRTSLLARVNQGNATASVSGLPFGIPAPKVAPRVTESPSGAPPRPPRPDDPQPF